MANNFEINDQIKEREIRVINNDGEQVGIMQIKDALSMAEEQGLDLVKISPNAKPPVCKIIDYNKFRYELTKKEKAAKKNQKVTVVKEIRFSLNIDKNDMQTKINQARKFLRNGNKVKVSLIFKGREIAYINNSKYMLEEFAEALQDISTIEKGIKTEGKALSMILIEK